MHVHSYGDWINITDTGAEKHCSGCDSIITHNHSLELNSEGNMYICTVCSYTLPVECEHNYSEGNSYLTNDPNRGCLEADMVCTKCGDSYTVVVAEHDWFIITYDGIKYMTCDNCGVEKEEPVNQNAKVYVIAEPQLCFIDDKKNKKLVLKI